MQPISRWRERKQKTGELEPRTSLSCTLRGPQKPWRNKNSSSVKGRKHETKRLAPVMPCFVNGALLLFSLNGLHFTLPCILATAISASFQSGINHCVENVWEICAVRSVPRMSPFVCFVCFSKELHLLISKHRMLARAYRRTVKTKCFVRLDSFDLPGK